MANSNLHSAKKNKEDEFYTQLSDIEKELKHYREHFKDKVVFCNCDDPEESNFWWYFKINFDFLGLKKLITTHYDESSITKKLIIDSANRNKDGNPKEVVVNLKGNGDFRSPESIELLKESDIVVTNPPFSLFREYLATLMEYDKQFLIIGSQNAVTYRDIFTYIKNNELWLGNNYGDMSFMVPDHYEPRKTRYWEDSNGQKWRSMGNMVWYTNLTHRKRYEELILVKRLSDGQYDEYDNYPGINVNTVKDIPTDYDGAMGVPITFLNKYNPEQFDIVQFRKGNDGRDLRLKSGKEPYFRILIKHKKD